MRRCRETDYNEYISLLRKSLLQGFLFSMYHFGHTRHYYLNLLVRSMFTVLTSSVWIFFLHLTQLEDGEMVLSRPLECFSCLLDLLFLILFNII